MCFVLEKQKKVGAPPQVASLLEEIGRENHPPRSSIELGTDPQLDNFMVLFVCLFVCFNFLCNFLVLLETFLTSK